jgi:bis(5'-nucleosyl)-tetraphosphatase (symmetrical)
MAIYAIGDVQGCFDEMRTLLKEIDFHVGRDQLWFTGDLVNRGPKSLEVMRFVKGLAGDAVTVLGNHDLHLLAVAEGRDRYRYNDTFDDVLNAPDGDELLDWLRHRPLLHHDARLGYTLIHAGLPPQWDLAQAEACAAEVEAVLRGRRYGEYFEHMYGNQPELWSDDLTGWERLRFITNCFTRLRYCDKDGRLALEEKGAPGSQTNGYLPWFAVPGRRSAGLNIVFGHWSTLGERADAGAYPLDTGCVWGGSLTALRLDGEPRWYRIPCPRLSEPE